MTLSGLHIQLMKNCEMTVWDFDEDDAENLYNLSQDEEKCNRSLNNRLEKLKYEGRYIDPEEVLFDETRYSKSNEEAKSEIEVNQSDEGGQEHIAILMMTKKRNKY